ncbi:MAG: hypothetical protein Q8N91_00310 [Candidatus Omnitrophota bacterium]|nr:hypothetical protein [Candidatus Omnitrophota bacterium]
MKCQFCNKNIDEIDCSCKMCTICGWVPDVGELKVGENIEKTPGPMENGQIPSKTVAAGGT